MKQTSKAMMTIVMIFAAAFILAAVGCAESGGSGTAAQQPVGTGQLDSGVDEESDQMNLQPINPGAVRECTQAEFAELISWRNNLDKANNLVDQSGGKQNKAVVDAALIAIKSCDSRFKYHSQQPCQKTKKTIVNPDKPEIKVYDAFRLKRDCTKVDNYLTKFNLRPDPKLVGDIGKQEPLPITPVNPEPIQPAPNQPAPVDSAPSVGGLGLCSNDEFAKLSEWSLQLDKANKNIAKLGTQAQWKYDSASISAATDAAKSCESLIKYHSVKPCEKGVKQTDGSVLKKQYTRETITQRCQTSRTYFYEFVQRTTTLNSANVDLYLDLSRFAQQQFEAQSFSSHGQCVVENRTNNSIDYSSRKALVKDSRGFESKMMVLETAEGLLIQCYGLDLDGPFSKNQVVKLLKAEGTDIRLEYVLK